MNDKQSVVKSTVDTLAGGRYTIILKIYNENKKGS